MQANPTTVPGSTPGLRNLTLDQAVDIALRNSKQLSLTVEAIHKARGRFNETRTAFLPNATGQVQGSRLNRGINATFPDANGQPQSTVIQPQDQYIITVTAGLPIDIMGQIKAASDQAHFGEVAAKLDYNRARNQLVLDTKTAYYDLLRAKAQVKVAEQALANAQERQKTAEAFLRAETGTRFDVLRAQTEVANAEQLLISARNRVSIAAAALNNVLNLDQNTPLDVAEQSVPAGVPSVDFDAELKAAYSTRPELLQADAQIAAARKGLVIAHRSVLPSLQLGWNFQYNPQVGAFGQQTQWTALATVSIPLFDQGLSAARTQQAKADVKSAELNKQIGMDSVALEVRQARLAFEEARERLRVTSAALAQAAESYRLAQVRFREGVTQVPGNSPLLEISDAQTALTQAQNNQLNAQYDLLTAHARLDRAVGRYAYVNPASPTPGEPKQAKEK
jgi:outer membrane protein TolC